MCEKGILHTIAEWDDIAKCVINTPSAKCIARGYLGLSTYYKKLLEEVITSL
jgi:hypothetical protein